MAGWAAAGGIGVHGVGREHTSLAGQFDGDVRVNGTLTTTVDIVLTGADCAEEFDVDGRVTVAPGTVMVFGECGVLEPAQRSYDRRVAGIVSGAGDFRPGLVLDHQQRTKPRVAIALVGKTYCLVDAREEPVEIGDLLTTSRTTGHAMKASDATRAFGAVLGKALDRSGGCGLLPVLVALQ